MADDKKGKNQPDEEYGGFIPAVFARSIEEAEAYRKLLDDHDIPAIIDIEESEVKVEPAEGGGNRRGLSRGVGVLVPEELLDEASVIIADLENADEFDVDDEQDDEEDETEGLVLELDDEEVAGEEFDEDLDEDDEDIDELDDDDEDEDLDEEEGVL